jgi:hypothetical protein
MQPPADWPFEDTPNVAAITTRPVMNGASWIALVSHDEDDGGWQFIGPEGADMDQAMLVGLKEVLERDGSIAELADLPLGWRAWRASRGAAWQRGRHNG